jgi:AhpD family alkylhydroperoxidase
MKSLYAALAALSLFSTSVVFGADQPAAESPTRAATIAEVEKDVGFVANLMAAMADSPAAPLVYTKSDVIMHDALLTQQEQQVVQLVVSLFNDCAYCSSAHSKLAEANGVSHADVVAIRHGKAPQDQHVAELVWITKTILEKRGHLYEQDLKRAADAGFDRPRIYEILAHMGRKMFANYAVHIIHPEIDEEFAFVE